MWELGKGGVNGDGTDELVVPYSTSFSAAGACNTAIVPLGCSEQAKAVCYYVLKYITKDPTALEATRVLVFQAILHWSTTLPQLETLAVARATRSIYSREC